MYNTLGNGLYQTSISRKFTLSNIILNIKDKLIGLLAGNRTILINAKIKFNIQPNAPGLFIDGSVENAFIKECYFSNATIISTNKGGH